MPVILPYTLERTVAPTPEPITRDSAKHQCSIELGETAFDPWFESGEGNVGAIARARELVEFDTGACLMNQTWALRLDRLPSGGLIELIRHPVRSISSVVYYDADDVSTTLAASNYELIRGRFFSYLVKADLNAVWPTISTSKHKPVTITYVAGYPDPATDTTDVLKRAKVPECAKGGMLVLLAHWFRNRESVLVGSISKEIEQGYKDLISPICQPRYS